MISDLEELIFSIDSLNKSKNLDGIQSPNIVSELITPEWYFSESNQIFGNIQITWNSILNSSVIQDISRNNTRYDAIQRDFIFEKSFCMWYQPFHFIPRTKWGIHLRFSSWMKLSSYIKDNVPFNIKESLTSSFLILYLHGFFHYILECFISNIELKTNKNIFNKYYIDFYLDSFNSIDCIEESFANTYLYKHRSEFHLDTQFLEQMLSLQGVPYNGFKKFIMIDSLNNSYEFTLLLKKVSKELSNFDFDKDLFLDLNSNELRRSITIPIYTHKEPRRVYRTQS
ncbi:MAG: hypothetical protein WCB31_08680 [Nitrososphaeraceae archaeon]